MSQAPSLLPALTPRGEFMAPLRLLREHVRLVPQSPGCYLIYLDEQPYYAGMSRTNIQRRLWAHATGRGSKRVRLMLALGRIMYFEYLDVYASESITARDVAGTEFFFMMMHTGNILPGNVRADGYLLLSREPTPPSEPPK